MSIEKFKYKKTIEAIRFILTHEHYLMMDKNKLMAILYASDRILLDKRGTSLTGASYLKNINGIYMFGIESIIDQNLLTYKLGDLSELYLCKDKVYSIYSSNDSDLSVFSENELDAITEAYIDFVNVPDLIVPLITFIKFKETRSIRKKDTLISTRAILRAIGKKEDYINNTISENKSITYVHEILKCD